MSQEVGQTELKAKTQQLLDGPLKHIRAAAIAAALLPLASVAATPASAQTAAQCASGGICGFVFNDTNNNGIQDAGETGIEGAKVTLCQLCDGSDSVTVETGPDGFYSDSGALSGDWTVAVQIPTGKQASPANAGANDALDSDGIPDGHGFSVTTVTVLNGINLDTDFGFYTPPATQQGTGTGTPGYWKNHPDAWPQDIKDHGITVGGVTYSWDDAIKWLGKVGKDKTTTMFSSLVPAMLNVLTGNTNCVSDAISAGNTWMATYGPVGSGVPASSPAWAVGEPTHQTLDAYNNGLLCAPHRK